MRRRTHAARQIRRALKVVHGKHDAPRHGIFPHGLAGKFAQRFYFKITPLASGFAGVSQPVEFTVNTTGELASALTAAAGSEKGGVPRMAFAQPAEELSAFCVTAEPVETQFDGAGLS